MSDRTAHVVASPLRASRRTSREDYLGWVESVKEVEREHPDLGEVGRKTRAAVREDTLSGRLRRALRDANPHRPTLCEQIGIDRQTLIAFTRGDVALPSDVTDRLVAVLGWEAVAAADPPTRPSPFAVGDAPAPDPPPTPPEWVAPEPGDPDQDRTAPASE